MDTSEKNSPRSGWRAAADAAGLLLFAVGVGALAYWYLAPALRPPPAPATPLAAVDAAALKELVRSTPAGEAAEAWTPDKLSARWKYIIIHHSASTGGNGRLFDRWHRARGMENGMAYHFVITNGRPQNGEGGADGAVEIGRRWLEQLDGGHVRGEELNHEAIGICLVGDFTVQMPTAAQIASCKALIRRLREITKIPVAGVIGHGAAPGQKTLCPGALPAAELAR